MSRFDSIYHWANNRVEGYVPTHEITNAELFAIILDLASAGMEIESRIKALEDEHSATINHLLANVEYEKARCEAASSQLNMTLKNMGLL